MSCANPTPVFGRGAGFSRMQCRRRRAVRLGAQLGRSGGWGRDANGLMTSAAKADQVTLEWSLEAQLCAPGTRAAVGRTPRLIAAEPLMTADDAACLLRVPPRASTTTRADL